MPLSSFNMDSAVDRERAFHWSNLRPLWSFDNMSKGATIPLGFVWNDHQHRWLWTQTTGRTGSRQNLDLDPSLGTDEVIEEQNRYFEMLANDADSEGEDDDDGLIDTDEEEEQEFDESEI